VIADIDPHAVVCHAPGMPFDGFTHEKGAIFNDVFRGMRVQIIGGSEWSIRRKSHMVLRLVLFERLNGGHYALTEPHLILLDWDGERARPGVTRHLSLSPIDRFCVLDPQPLTPCCDCGGWFAPEKLVGWTPWEPPGERAESRIECRPCFESM
jgi:hypothetical protein